MKFLLDSVVVIDHLNGHGPATRFLLANGAHCSLSVITRAEVLAGDGDAAARRAWTALLDRFPCHAIDAAVADAAAELRRAHRFRLPDALQASVALQHGLRLVTRNVKDFPPRRHPFVLVPYRL